MQIVRIVIKGASGYGPVDEAYEDKVTLTPSSISYKYNPQPYAQSETIIHKQWSYKTDSPAFRELFEAIAAKTPEYLYNNDELLMALDIGSIDLVVTFEDKHKESLHLFCPSEYCADLFRLCFLLKRIMNPSIILVDCIIWRHSNEWRFSYALKGGRT